MKGFGTVIGYNLKTATQDTNQQGTQKQMINRTFADGETLKDEFKDLKYKQHYSLIR